MVLTDYGVTGSVLNITEYITLYSGHLLIIIKTVNYK